MNENTFIYTHPFYQYLRSCSKMEKHHFDVPRDLPLRMAMNEWDRDEVSELVRA